MKSTKTTKSYAKYVRYYINGRKLLHYRVAGLLLYRLILLHYQAVITLLLDFITLSGSYYINGRLLHYRL